MNKPNLKTVLAAVFVSLLPIAAYAQQFSPSPPPVTGAPQTTTVFIPKGTVIVVETTEGLSSYAAAPREPITYQVAQDVVVNGYIVAKTGDNATGMILESEQGKSGFYGVGYKAADLRVDAEVVNNFCGDALKIHFVRSEYRRRQGFMGSNKDITIAKDQMYAATVAFPQKICGTPTTETSPAIPPNALPSDQN